MEGARRDPPSARRDFANCHRTTPSGSFPLRSPPERKKERKKSNSVAHGKSKTTPPSRTPVPGEKNQTQSPVRYTGGKVRREQRASRAGHDPGPRWVSCRPLPRPRGASSRAPTRAVPTAPSPAQAQWELGPTRAPGAPAPRRSPELGRGPVGAALGTLGRPRGLLPRPEPSPVPNPAG